MCTICMRKIWVATLKVKVTAWPWSIIMSGPYLCYLRSYFKTISLKWSPYWDEVLRARFGLLPWRSRSQHDLAAKSCPPHSLNLKFDFKTISKKWLPYRDDVLQTTFGSIPWRSRSQHDLAAKLCPAHNIVMWSRILQIFHRNDHHIETTCHAQYLGRYLVGQGHRMTLQKNHVWPITLLFEIGFHNYFTEMITIFGWHVSRNILVATLKVKVTGWPCSKNVSGP